LLVILYVSADVAGTRGIENAVDARLADDLRATIDRTGTELAALTEMIQGEPAP
jgi:hypothetical protein